LYEQIARNKRRTVFLILGTLIFVGGLGYLFGLFLNVGFVVLFIALLIAAGLTLSSFR